jgi:hypothetical protein
VKPKSAVVPIGKARVRPVRMQPLYEPINEPKPVVVPLVQVPAEKPVRRKLRPSRLSGCQGSDRGIDSLGNLVQQSVEKAADLRVGRCPKTVGVSSKGLVEMAPRYRKAVLVEQAGDFVLCFGNFIAVGNARRSVRSVIVKPSRSSARAKAAIRGEGGEGSRQGTGVSLAGSKDTAFSTISSASRLPFSRR